MTKVSYELPAAFEFLHEPARLKVAYGGRGGAKSTAFANALLEQGMERPLRILCAREIQHSIKESVHALLAARIIENGMSEFYEVLQTEIRGRNGTSIFFAGLWQNIDSIKSIEGVDRCWVEEANKVSENSWQKLIPTIRKPGSEIWVSFNPDLKSDPAYRRFVLNPPPYAVVRKVSWRDNPWVSQEMLVEMEHLKATDYDTYLHVWEGELKQFADGAIYALQLRTAHSEKRIASIPIERGVLVNTFWDLGRNDTTAIWLHQRCGVQNRFIACHESRLVGLDYYARWLREFASEHNISYGKHYLPHDVEHTELVANMSRREMLEQLGIKPVITVPRISEVEKGIAMTRQAFDSCWFDAERCSEGLEALANYRYVFDEKYDTYRRVPLHDWSSNYADAFRQFGQGYAPDKGWDAVANPSGMSTRRAEALRHHSTFRSPTAWIT